MAKNLKAAVHGETPSEQAVHSSTDTPARGKNRTYPNLTLKKALAVAQAIQDHASGTSVKRLILADLMQKSPESSVFQGLVQASRAFGLTTGGVHAPEYALTSLGEAATGADEIAQQHALRQAVLSVEPYNRFLTAFDNKRLPAANVSKDFLVSKAKVPSERADECLQFLRADAQFVGLIRNVRGADYIDLQGTPSVSVSSPAEYDTDDDLDGAVDLVDAPPQAEAPRLSVVRGSAAIEDAPNPAPPRPRKLFIAHGKDRGPLEQVKKILDALKIPYAVAVDEPNRGRPISAKVAGLMRDDCSSAIFIFTADEHFMKEDEHGQMNDVWRPSENAIFELGAASILYDRRIVILKDKRVTLPSDFSDLGHIPFEAGGIELQMAELVKELLSLGILKLDLTV